MDLSIVIPVYNEQDFIAISLESIFSCLQTVDFAYEIVVVNNGSTDGTLDILGKFRDISVFSIDRTTVSCARNFGALKASGDLLAFIDGDVVITVDWVNAIAALIEDNDGKAILTGSKCRSRPDGTWIERYWFSSLESSHINSGNLIISRSAFNYLGGFNRELKTGEDVDLCDRAKLSEEVTFVKNINFSSIHLDYPRTLKRFFLRELWHGEGDLKSLRFFLQSKVALVSVFYGVASIALVYSIIACKVPLAILLSIILISTNLFVTLYRIKDYEATKVFFCFVLNYFYFMARFLSIFRAVFKKNRRF